jgi:hypothetical protein
VIPTLNPETVAILKELGIPIERARRALFARRTGNRIMRAAISYHGVGNESGLMHADRQGEGRNQSRKRFAT